MRTKLSKYGFDFYDPRLLTTRFIILQVGLRLLMRIVEMNWNFLKCAKTVLIRNTCTVESMYKGVKLIRKPYFVQCNRV